MNLTEQQFAELEELIKTRAYNNRSEAIRNAVLLLLEKKKLEELERKMGNIL